MQLLTSLLDRLPQQGSNSNSIPLFFALDEISNLAIDSKPTVFLALRRVIILLNKLPVWTFTLSTQSPFQLVSPSVADDPLSRVTKRQLERVTHSIPLLWILRQAGCCVSKDERLSLPLAEFSKIFHIVTFGRPLQVTYSNSSSAALRRSIRFKLLCTQKYILKDRNHLLAILAN